MRSITYRAWLIGRFGLLLLLPVFAGCSPGHGKVSGQVKLNGTPLSGGRVTFRPTDASQNSVSVVLDEQGNFEAVLPAGEVSVSVDNRELEPKPTNVGLPNFLSPEMRKQLSGMKADAPVAGGPSENAPEKLPGKYVKIPDKYYEAESSGLQFKVEGGDQKHDLELTAEPPHPHGKRGT